MGDSDNQPPAPGGAGYWFTPVPVYLIEASFNPDSPVNGSAVTLWAHLHRNYAWRKRMFPSYATLAEETGQSQSAVKRQLIALREAGALDWSPNYSQRGRSSNDYALAPIRPFEFDRDLVREVEVKNELHRPVEVKNELGVEVKSDRHPQFKNDPVVEEHRVSTDLSSRLPQQATEPPAAPTASQAPRQQPKPAETQPAAKEPTAHQVADELTKAFWNIHGKSRTQPYVSVLKIVRAAIGNGVPRDDLARALDQVARSGSIASWKLDNALADLHTSRGGARTITQTTEPAKTGLNL